MGMVLTIKSGWPETEPLTSGLMGKRTRKRRMVGTGRRKNPNSLPVLVRSDRTFDWPMYVFRVTTFTSKSMGRLADGLLRSMAMVKPTT